MEVVELITIHLEASSIPKILAKETQYQGIIQQSLERFSGSTTSLKQPSGKHLGVLGRTCSMSGTSQTQM